MDEVQDAAEHTRTLMGVGDGGSIMCEVCRLFENDGKVITGIGESIMVDILVLSEVCSVVEGVVLLLLLQAWSSRKM